MYSRLVIFQSFSFFFLLLEIYKESFLSKSIVRISCLKERYELIIEEILHPTFSFLSASITGSKLHEVCTVSVR